MTMSESPKLLVTMTCPSCGGQVECAEGENLVVCKYCDTVCCFETDAGAAKVMYKGRVTKDEATAAALKWMKSGPKAKDLAAASKISEIYPIYLPFWRLVARGKACVCGVEIHKDKDGHETRIPRETLINREYVYCDIACDPGDLGIPSISVPPQAEAIPYNDQDIIVFEATKSRTDGFNEGGEMIKLEAIEDGQRKIDRVEFSKAFFFPKSFTEIFYPFWIIRYKYRERDYFVTIDGVTGKPTSGRAPGSVGSQSTSAGVGGTIAGAAVGFGFVGGYYGFTDAGSGELGIGIVIVGFIVAIVVFGFFWKRFRYGDEILEGSLKGKGLSTRGSAAKVQTTSAPSYDYFN